MAAIITLNNGSYITKSTKNKWITKYIVPDNGTVGNTAAM